MPAVPFNADEVAAQALAGGGPRSAVGVRDLMPDQHRLFFTQLPYLFIAAIDHDGWPLATLITGRPGFVQSPDAVTLRISALPQLSDPAREALVPERDIGILGIDFSTRRRNRANGRIMRRDAGAFDVAVSQSFGNCPQYIQRRTLEVSASEPTVDRGSSAVEAFEQLDPAAQAAIGSADTFFVASRSRPGEGGTFGADISHRGGRNGFIRVEGSRLTIPDFRGNRFFNTLSNLMAEPRSALLFLDFETGDMLQLQGVAEVAWSSEANAFPGAERLWYFRVERGYRRRSALQLRWSFTDYSRATLETGLWHDAVV
jgi:uncharacterized protein